MGGAPGDDRGTARTHAGVRSGGTSRRDLDLAIFGGWLPSGDRGGDQDVARAAEQGAERQMKLPYTRENVTSVLKRLGETPDEVAARLLEQRCFGRKFSGFHCPVAEYLAAQIDARLIVATDDISTRVHDLLPLGLGSNPPPPPVA